LTTTYGFVKKVSDISKRLRPKAPVIAGNMVSTAYPELLLSNSSVDICVIDEAEITIQDLMACISNGLDLSKVRGIVYRAGEKFVRTPYRERIKDLDAIPFPAWDLFSMETYIRHPIHNEYGKRSINVSTVRGCPFQCVYCSRPFGSRVVIRSIEGVVNEIKTLKKRYDVSFVGFSDDLFILNRKWVESLCRAFIDERVDIKWGASARVNLIDPLQLKLMYRAGCRNLSYGFESGSQRILNDMKKGVKVEQAVKAVEYTRKAGITVEGSFMIGMFEENEESVNETVSFIKRTGLPIYRFFNVTPYPGTYLYNEAKKKGIIPRDEDKYVESLGEMYHTMAVNLTSMSDDELRRLKSTAERKIVENFSMRARTYLMLDEMRRYAYVARGALVSMGFFGGLRFILGKIWKRIGRRRKIS